MSVAGGVGTGACGGAATRTEIDALTPARLVAVNDVDPTPTAVRSPDVDTLATEALAELHHTADGLVVESCWTVPGCTVADAGEMTKG